MYDIKQYEHFISIHSHIISFPLACAQTTILYVYFTYVNRLLNYKLLLNKIRCSYKSAIICSLLNDPISQGMFSILFLIIAVIIWLTFWIWFPAFLLFFIGNVCFLPEWATKAEKRFYSPTISVNPVDRNWHF